MCLFTAFVFTFSGKIHVAELKEEVTFHSSQNHGKTFNRDLISLFGISLIFKHSVNAVNYTVIQMRYEV